ncbi:ATP-dependent Clp protease adaptor ClpS [Kutzneria sp. NPDC052558]|uniref:ATP-dependent Clp protease adaptor ClpS n=1 Tax=Kutzneria sp. NPDC052558 TaxID=3364121 RepID=UPI0037C80E66
MTDWHIVVHNDEVNTFPLVVDVFQRIVGLSMDEAIAGMRRVHEHGSAMISAADRAGAEAMVARLHTYGLDASVGRADR